MADPVEGSTPPGHDDLRRVSPTPELDGRCAFALSVGKVGVAGSPKHAVARDGKVYVFKNGAARLLWRLLPNREDKARRTWQSR